MSCFIAALYWVKMPSNLWANAIKEREYSLCTVGFYAKVYFQAIFLINNCMSWTGAFVNMSSTHRWTFNQIWNNSWFRIRLTPYYKLCISRWNISENRRNVTLRTILSSVVTPYSAAHTGHRILRRLILQRPIRGSRHRLHKYR